MTATQLALLAGAVLSLFFSYVPGLNVKFAVLSSEIKRLIMLGLLIVVAAAVYGLSCTTFAADIGIQVTCDQPGLVQMVTVLILAVISNQSVYTVSPQLPAVREAKTSG